MFIDFEKAFNSVDRNTLWSLLAHYGVLRKIIQLMNQLLYTVFQAQVVHDDDLSKPFDKQRGVGKGYLLSLTLFLVALDWIM